MFSSADSDEDELLLLLPFCINKRRKWVHDVNLMRNNFGEFHHLKDQLRKDESKFKEYFRMRPEQFDRLLGIIENHIEKQKTNYRESIHTEERLALCLR